MKQGGRLGPYRHFIEVLVESSAIYAIPAALYLAFILRDNPGSILPWQRNERYEGVCL